MAELRSLDWSMEERRLEWEWAERSESSSDWQMGAQSVDHSVAGLAVRLGHLSRRWLEGLLGRPSESMGSVSAQW